MAMIKHACRWVWSWKYDLYVEFEMRGWLPMIDGRIRFYQKW